MKSIFRLMTVFAVRGVAAAGGIILSILIARLSGPELLGQFAIFISLLAAGAILARRGIDMLLIRAVARVRVKGAANVSTTLVINGLKKTFSLSMIIAMLGSISLWSGVWGVPLKSAEIHYLLALPIFTSLALIAGYLKGMERPWIAPLFEIGGISLIACCLLFLLMLIDIDISGGWILLAFFLSLLFMLGIAFLIIRRDSLSRGSIIRPGSVNEEWENELDSGQLSFTMIALSALLVQAGAFILAAPFLSEEQLGLIRAAERLALIVSFPVLAISPYIAPKIVRHVDSYDRDGLLKLMIRAIAAGGVMGMPFLLVYIIMPESALGIMGAAFVDATPYLISLALTHFVLVLLGPFSMLLSMSGGEQIGMRIGVVILILAVSAYPLMVSSFGAKGFVITYIALSVLRALLITYFASNSALSILNRG